jgi:hypothetical protein
LARGIWAGVLVILALSITGTVAVLRHGIAVVAPTLTPPVSEGTLFQQAFYWLIAFALVLPVLGGGGSLGRAAREFASPRLNSVRRTAFFVAMLVLVLAVSTSFLFVAAVPKDQARVWAAIPVSALAQFLPVPAWLAGLLTFLVFGAALSMLAPAASAALEDSEQLLRRLSAETLFPGDMSRLSGWKRGRFERSGSSLESGCSVDYFARADRQFRNRFCGAAQERGFSRPHG